MPNLFNYTEGKYLRMIFIESSFLYEAFSPCANIILKELHKCIIQPILFEDDPASKVEVNEGNKGRMVNFEVHGFKDSPFCLLILLLTK